MEWSKYNLLLTDKKKEHFYLYNTISSFFTELPGSVFKTLLNFKQGGFNLVSPNVINIFKLKGIIVENNSIEFMKMKGIQRISRFDTTRLLINILCEECKGRNVFGSRCREVEDGIFKFVRMHDKVKKVTLDFHASDLSFIPSANSLYDRLKCQSYDFLEYAITMKLSVLDRIKPYDVTCSEALKYNILVCGEELIDFKDIVFVKDIIDLFIRHEKKVRVILMNHTPLHVQIYQQLMSVFENEHVNFVDYNQFDLCFNIDGPIVSSKIPYSPFKECIATKINGFIIKSDGTIFKCWNDVFQNTNNIIGSVIDKSKMNIDKYLSYVTSNDGFEEPECMTCKLLPVCGGGCPRIRMECCLNNKKFTCKIKETGIENFLENIL